MRPLADKIMDMLFYLGWFAATGAVAVAVVFLLSACTADEARQFREATEGLRAGTSSAADGWRQPTYQHQQPVIIQGRPSSRAPIGCTYQPLGDGYYRVDCL